jgi:hypothetical protein
MLAIAAAIEALFADPNLARDATYQPADGEPLPVRVIVRRADAVTDFGDARLWSETTRFDLRAARSQARGRATGSCSTARASSSRASRSAIANGWSGCWR